MTIEEILKYSGLVLSGSFITAVGNFFLKRKELLIKDKESLSTIEKSSIEADLKSFETLKDTWYNEFKRNEERFEKLWSNYAKLETRFELLEIENADLRLQLINLKTYHPEMPIPMWLKDTNGKMLSLNQAYEDMFLFPQSKTRLDYIGNYDEAIWNEDIADAFRSNDLIATSTKSFVEVHEELLDNPLLKPWRFYKYPIYSQGVFIGIAGLALPREKKLEI